MHPQLGGGIVGLADVADQAGGRGEQHIGPVLLLAEQLDRRAADVERAGQMDIDHRFPVGRGHLVEHPVAQNARRVDHRVEPAELFQRLIAHPFDCGIIGNAVEVGDRAATARDDLLGHGQRGGGRAVVVALERAAQIVDHHRRALARGHQRAFAPDPVAAAGDQHDLAVEYAHVPLPYA